MKQLRCPATLNGKHKQPLTIKGVCELCRILVVSQNRTQHSPLTRRLQ